MTETMGQTLALDEPLLWERGKEGRCGFSLPARDVPAVMTSICGWAAARRSVDDVSSFSPR